MNQREAKKHKIEWSWQVAYEHKQQVKKLKRVSDNFYSSNSDKNQYLYETEWKPIHFKDTPTTYKNSLQFKNFPEGLIPFIKVDLLFKTSDGKIGEADRNFGFDFRYNLEQENINNNTSVLTVYSFTKGWGILPLYYKILITIINTQGYNEIQIYKTQS